MAGFHRRWIVAALECTRQRALLPRCCEPDAIGPRDDQSEFRDRVQGAIVLRQRLLPLPLGTGLRRDAGRTALPDAARWYGDRGDAGLAGVGGEFPDGVASADGRPMIMPRLVTALADRYQIERELGQGGMATVYLARDVRHDREVALKVLKPELAAVLGAERFVVEIKTTASLQHPHTLPLFDSGRAEGFLYYVMPFIDGETLRAKLNRETQLGIDEGMKIAIDVADALDYAPPRGGVHHDIKPENILLHEGRPVVADFGIALAVSAAADGRRTESGLSLGTPHYMSPEQATAEKEITARSDIYSLASVLYEMLAGEPPHSGGSAQQIIMKIVTEEAQPLTRRRKAVPAHIAAAVAQGLEKLPADRFESAARFAEALRDPRVTMHRVRPAVAQRGTAALATPAARWAVALGLLVGGGAIGWRLHTNRADALAPVTHFTISVPGGLDVAGIVPMLSIAPDGRSLAYFQDGILYRRRLERDGPEPRGALAVGCCAAC